MPCKQQKLVTRLDNHWQENKEEEEEEDRAKVIIDFSTGNLIDYNKVRKINCISE